MLTETRYAYNGDLAVAYRTFGEGPRDIVFVTNWFVSAEAFPEIPSIQPWLERMATLGRMIFFDQPGTGSSDPVSMDAPPMLEQWADSITAVLDTLGSEEAVLLTIDRSLSTGALFAATYPNRTSALIMLEAYISSQMATTNVEGFGDVEQATTTFNSLWGTGELQRIMNPEMPWTDDVRAAWAKQERLAASPKMVTVLFPLNTTIDVKDLLPTIRVPTLVLHHRDDPLITVDRGREVAQRIPGAKMVEIPGRNMYLFVEPGWRQCFEEISEFLTGVRPEPVEDDRVLATVLFTDIVDSTKRAADMGDRDWRVLLDAHDAVIRSQLTRFRGREVSTAGDSFLATFDGPQRAIRCAIAIREAVRGLGIEVRAGLHTGECEVRGDDVGGIAVHIGARVSALAEANEILVSGTLRDLVVGSGLSFDDRGAHELKGVPGEWRLYAVTG